MKAKLYFPYNAYDDGDFDSDVKMSNDEYFDAMRQEEIRNRNVAFDFVNGRRYNRQITDASWNEGVRHNDGKVRLISAECVIHNEEDKDKQKVGKENDKKSNGEELTDEEQAEVQKLKERDQEVRTHEKAHQTAGGQYASAPVYDFKKGPDGKDYAVGGHVNIDTSKESDPDKTIEKMRVVIKAAKAPAQPSGQDMKVAAEAQQTLNEAQMEKAKKQQEAMKANENPQKTEDSETEVQSEDIRTETPETKPQASLSEA